MYETSKVNDIPPREIFEEAIRINKCPIGSYKQISQCKNSIKYILSHLKKPILFGMIVYSNFMKLTKENDILEKPSKDDELLGGHGVCLIGFDDSTERF